VSDRIRELLSNKVTYEAVLADCVQADFLKMKALSRCVTSSD
jgi:hypothetical protein